VSSEPGAGHCSVLIEVKTSEELTLKFKKSYLRKLSAYANLLNQPLLVAWRPRQIGFWILFDPMLAEPLDDEHVQVSLEQAIRNDLMSILAGDYYLVPQEGAGVRLEFERIGEKQPTQDGYQAMFRVSDAYFHEASGTRVPDIPNSLAWMIFSAVEDRQEVTENGIVQSFVTSGGFTRAQLVLRTAVGFSLNDEERIHWKTVGSNLDSVLTCDSLLADVQGHFGTLVQYVFHQQPRSIPHFLPLSWRGRFTKIAE
jgi:hypothetical protein